MTISEARHRRWGPIRPAAVVTVVRRVMDSAGRLQGSWRWFVLSMLPVGGSQGPSQENHMITTTVWTHGRRFWKEG